MSIELLTKAQEELEQGDVVQASEKGWGAAAQAVKAVAEQRGWRHRGHRQLFQAVQRLAEESADVEIVDLFRIANSLHTNFYEDWLPQETVGRALQQVGVLLDRLESLKG